MHGFVDYFFQTHLADFFVDRGWDFYALDLRRYGRSLRRDTDRLHHRPQRLLTELDTAAELIAEDPTAAAHRPLHRRPDRLAVGRVKLRPDLRSGAQLSWLDLQGSAIVRTLGTPVIDALGSRNPTSILRLPPDLGHYPRTVHVSLEGEWDYDMELKRTPGPPVRAGWLRAILLGHQRVAAGLDIRVPILVLASTATEFARKWHEGLRTVDVILDVDQIAARAVKLGPHVTVVRIADGMHDLVLSAANVRKVALDEIGRFVEGYVKSTPKLLEDPA